MSIEIQPTEAGFALMGDIHFKNVMQWRSEGNRFIKKSELPELEIDLSRVGSNDTSALSLLLRWVSYAEEQDKRIRFVAVPDALLKVAAVCGISQFIGG